MRPYLDHRHDAHFFLCGALIFNLIAMKLACNYLRTCSIERINHNKNPTLLKTFNKIQQKLFNKNFHDSEFGTPSRRRASDMK
jgi:hypothetical protein